jgi:hypothetical protein
MVTWLKEKWEIVLGAALAILGGTMVLLRFGRVSKEHRENFKDARESHDAELKVERESSSELDSGLHSLSKGLERERGVIVEEFDDKNSELEREKAEFVDEAKDSDELARSIADMIGADFVENKEK